jgi:hypothetical protein
MAAGLGFKDFTTGEVLTAADVDGYLMQGVWVFASAAARDAAVTSPQEGNFAYLKDTNVTTYYTGSAWANLDTTGMTNPMTTTGDTIYSSSGSTPARLGIGSTGNVLTVAGGVPTWAAPASGGGMTLLTSGALSGSSTVFSFTSTGYINIQIHFKNVWLNSSANGIKMRINADTGSNYANGRYQLSPTIGDGNQVTDHFLLTFRANGGSQAFYKNGHGIVTLYRPTDTDVIYMVGDCSGTDSVSSGDTWYNHIIGIYDCSAAVSSITLFPNANDFANGNAYVYGVK